MPGAPTGVTHLLVAPKGDDFLDITGLSQNGYGFLWWCGNSFYFDCVFLVVFGIFAVVFLC